jgi:TetR/AcrR family transcriptional regulator
MNARRQAKTREKRDPEATRKALLAAARHLFSERGFDGVSIDEVAEEAGVNKALISYHFGGKRALYLAVLQEGFASLAGRLVESERSAVSAAAALEAVAQAFAGYAAEAPRFPAMFLREILSAGVEPVVAPHILAIVGVSRRILERGVAEGLFRTANPLSFHLALVGSLVFFFATEPMRRVAGPRFAPRLVQPSAAEFVRHLVEINLRGLAPAPAPRRRKEVRS